MNSDKGVTEAYCRMVLSELQQIELKSIERREISEQIKKRVQFNFEIVAGVISFFVAWGFLLTGIIKNSTLSSLMGVVSIFVLTYITCVLLWHTPLFARFRRANFERRLNNSQEKIDEINRDNTNLLLSKDIKESYIPRQYLSIQVLTILLRYFENNQASFLNEAIGLFEDDLAHTEMELKDISKENVIDREVLYLGIEF
ncbi:hypothetical protein [Lactococcus fujiensis]|nr:hypothetical protein [Lactococcus fujiensis]